MDEDDKPKFEPGATMQIDLAQVQLVDLDKGRERSKPPPLPPTAAEVQPVVHAAMSAPPPRSSAPLPPAPAPAPAPATSRAKNLMHVGIIVAVVALAIVAGLAVGKGVRGSAAAAPGASAPTAIVSTPAPVVSQTTQTAPSNEVLTIPPVEVK